MGGTFTDVVLYDSADQRVWLAKTPSTPEDQSVGVIEGIRLAATRADVGLPSSTRSSTARPWPRTPCSSGAARSSA